MASLKFAINGDMKKYVAETAEEQHTSEVEIIRRSVEAFRVLDKIRRDDGEVVLKRKDGTLVQLVRF